MGNNRVLLLVVAVKRLGVRIDVDGVDVDGSWKFLWMKAKPKLVSIVTTIGRS